ncbi:MAG: 2-oxo-4-hydroxy-4-carboxy-5-ureidoimidazoline decarboxylase [Leptolyngbyaceae cyanobacterium MAG.088]|nr:2-oxo-4-hydroxy-4-carboxy-5-ureidoimidazoline decarboxylase [Leptolyngbyaceae cyanobacterium MAG.088]
MGYRIIDINQMPQAEFVAALGGVFEATPSIAEQVWCQRPFEDLSQLHQAMVTIVEQLPEASQLALIRAHPDLGSRVQMASASVKEQASVGLDRLSPSEYEQFQQLNATYQAKFGFPFIMAVTGQRKETILAVFAQRVCNDPVNERQQALLEIGKIARFRLDMLFA